jgi:hypothetical protein
MLHSLKHTTVRLACAAALRYFVYSASCKIQYVSIATAKRVASVPLRYHVFEVTDTTSQQYMQQTYDRLYTVQTLRVLQCSNDSVIGCVY